MAITKIWNIAKSKDGNLSNSLHCSLLYIVNPVKTDGGVLVGGVNVMPDAELAYEQMCETKQIFGKELGRQGYHVVLSCPVGEGDPQTMYQLKLIGMEDNLEESDKNIAKVLEKRKFDSCLNKRMVIVLSNTARTDIEI